MEVKEFLPFLSMWPNLCCEKNILEYNGIVIEVVSGATFRCCLKVLKGTKRMLLLNFLLFYIFDLICNKNRASVLVYCKVVKKPSMCTDG